jgi:hypothetical protein
MEVVCVLKGGLGNQLFQWVAAKKLARSLGWKLRFDTRSYVSDTHGRKPLIQNLLNVPGSLGHLDRVEGLTKRILTILENQESLEFLANIRPGTTITEDLDGIILDGYWQDSRLVSDEYVDETRNKLFEIRQFKDSIDWHDITNSERPVSVHLRRHDYGHHGVCLPDFYVTTCSMLLKKTPNYKFFVFSDEPNFAKWLFMKHGIPVSVIQEQDPLLTLNLMSQCCVHIISNSTFSWWGARLAKAVNVFVPFPWSLIHIPSEHIVPEHWTVIDNVVHGSDVSPVPFAALEKLRFAIS